MTILPSYRDSGLPSRVDSGLFFLRCAFALVLAGLLVALLAWALYGLTGFAYSGWLAVALALAPPIAILSRRGLRRLAADLAVVVLVLMRH